jgi:hypothetical protein
VERLEPTRKLALRFAWALLWRLAICSVLIGLFQVYLLSALTHGLNLEAGGVNTASFGLTLLIGLPLSLLALWECLYRITDLRLGDLSLLLVRHEEGEE